MVAAPRPRRAASRGRPYHRGHHYQNLLSALWFARLEDEAQARYHLELMPPEMAPHRGNNFALALLGEPIAPRGRAGPRLEERLYDYFLPFADRYAFVGMSMMHWEGPVSRLLALLAARLERWDEAVARFDVALARLGRLEARPLLAPRPVRARPHAARARARRGSSASERELLRDARALAVALEMPGLLRLVDARAGDAASPAPAARGPSAPAPAPAAGISLVLAGEYWTLTGSGGRDLRLQADSLGLQYLARLVAEPGREIHVLDLAGGGASGRGARDGRGRRR